MGADVEHQITRLHELGVKALHGGAALPVAVIDAQRAKNSAGGSETVEHAV
jgi:hypothetical protein